VLQVDAGRVAVLDGARHLLQVVYQLTHVPSLPAGQITRRYVAATLTEANELTYVSFPIEKTETTADGDLIVYGKATDGSVDHDQQIVDPAFAAKAVPEWLESGGNIRVQHNAQRDPAGVGISVEHDGDATWVKSLVVEPVAQKLVAKGALRAYSVGIARPTIVRDQQARGGRITGGQVVEISLVDRPANKSCGIQLVKSADDGTPEYTGEVFGDSGQIAKMLSDDAAEKSVSLTGDISEFVLPDDLTVSFTPADMARLMQQKIIQKHYDELAQNAIEVPDAFKVIADAEQEILGKDHREFSSGRRQELASSGHALPDGSYPVPDADALRRAAILARSGHGNVAAARRLIARRAKELGVSNPLDEDDKVKKEAEIPEAAVKEDVPEITKEPPADSDEKPKAKKAAKPGKKKPGKNGKKMPPWLQQDNDDAQKSDSESPDESEEDGDESDSSVSGDSCKQDHVHTEKCRTTPAQAAGLIHAHDMQAAPVPADMPESPAMPSTASKGATPQSASGATDAPPMKPAARHREPDGAEIESFEKDAGMSDGDHEAPTKLEAPTLARIAGDPQQAAVMRFKMAGADLDLGRLHDLTCPAFHPEDVAKHHPFADFATLIDERTWQQKALTAACGDLTAAKTMVQLWQDARTLRDADPAVVNEFRLAAHKAFRDANPGPASYPSPGSMSPQKFNRPCVTDGHAAQSPGHSGPNTSPQVATSAPTASSFDRPPLGAGHQSPSPSFMKASWEYPGQHGVPQQLTYEHMLKEQAHEALNRMHEHLGAMVPTLCPMDLNADPVVNQHPLPPTEGIGKAAEPEIASVAEPETAKASGKKMRKKLGKRVLSGKMTVDEARAQLGRRATQKTVTKSVAAEPLPAVTTLEPAVFPAQADLIKSAVAEAITPLMATITAQKQQLDDQQQAIDLHKQRFDQLADRPDPATEAFTGLGLNPAVMKTRQAAPAAQAEVAERAQQMVQRQLERTWRMSEHPAEREAAYAALARMRGIAD
jgi:hypothetical protein